MKSYTFTFPLFLLFCGLLVGNSAIAQRKDSPVQLATENNSLGSFPAFVMTVPEADEKVAVDEFRRLIKEFGGKAKKVKGEYIAEEVYINALCGTDPIVVYAEIEGKRSSGTEIIVWFKCRDIYIGDGSAARDLEEAYSIMEELYDDVLYEAIDLQCQDEQREHDKLEKKLKNLERDLEGYERDIERAKEMIARAEENIVKNAAAQEDTREAITKQVEVTQACEKRRDAVRQ